LSEANLNYTRILSPVDGIVISRKVDIGQTVAANFQTPTLFTIAQDLTKMQVDTSVDEADIGKIQVGQDVVFTVDAFPEFLFQGKVGEIRNAPASVQNVITYTVAVKVDNPEYKLKPGMTAHASIIISTRRNILRLPNAALRFKPADGQGSHGDKEKKVEAAGRPNPTSEIPGSKKQFVWVPGDKRPKRVAVITGISDGNWTEIIAGDLREADQVIIEETASAKRKNPAPRSGSLH
jgi:HlyD family secretion protein